MPYLKIVSVEVTIPVSVFPAINMVSPTNAKSYTYEPVITF